MFKAPSVQLNHHGLSECYILNLFWCFFRTAGTNENEEVSGPIQRFMSFSKLSEDRDDLGLVLSVNEIRLHVRHLIDACLSIIRFQNIRQKLIEINNETDKFPSKQ